MRKLLALVLILSLFLSLACAQAEQDNFVVSDWSLHYTFDGTEIAEQSLFIYEDGTFEVMDETKESKKGSWTFDGETLVLTADGESLSLKWDKEAHQFTGEHNSMALTMSMPIEPESAEVPPAGTLDGGWAIAEDQTVTEDINSIFFRGLDSYQTGTITVAYTPVALLGTQVVAGTNYAILSKASEINKGSKWVIIYLYQDLQGNASVLNITDVPLGI